MTLQPEITEHSDYRECAQLIRKHGLQKFPEGYSRIVFTNGCFDLVHPGHLKVLSYAKNAAGPKGAVVVGLNSDLSVKKIKGPNRPLLDEQSRGSILISLRMVDHVVLFDEETPRRLIECLMPDLIVKGGDYKIEDVVGHDLALIEIVPRDSDFSTTSLLRKILDG